MSDITGVSIAAQIEEQLEQLMGKIDGVLFWSNAADPTSSDTETIGADGAKNLLHTLEDINKEIIDEQNGTRALQITGSLPIALEFPKSTTTGTPTTTSLPLVSAAAFQIRDLINVKNGNNPQRACVTNKVSNTLTITTDLSGDTSIPLQSAPAAGVTVEIWCGQMGVRTNTSAGLHTIFPESKFKTANVAFPVTITIPLVS